MKAPIARHEVPAGAQADNLTLIVDFHNEVKCSFQQEVSRMDYELEDGSLPDHEKAVLRAKRDTYLNTFGPYLRVNTFLMMVSHLEEWLLHTWRHRAPATGLLEAKGSVGRFKPVLKEIGVDLSRSGSWMFLKGCQDVRSCLLHANGRVSLNRNPDRIRNFVAQYGDMIRIESDRLVLEELFLTRLQEAIGKLMASANDARAGGFE